MLISTWLASLVVRRHRAADIGVLAL